MRLFSISPSRSLKIMSLLKPSWIMLCFSFVSPNLHSVGLFFIWFLKCYSGLMTDLCTLGWTYIVPFCQVDLYLDQIFPFSFCRLWGNFNLQFRFHRQFKTFSFRFIVIIKYQPFLSFPWFSLKYPILPRRVLTGVFEWAWIWETFWGFSWRWGTCCAW